ncbi:acyltransferase domain-containing protein, partial [Frankia sp. AiPs1]|nr:acyltransferase domain-containing protein [Frankia sp. AiPs1]
MARDLLATSPTFAHHLTAATDALNPHLTYNLLDLLTSPTPPPTTVDVVQPALFAVMTSLARLWQHHNINPDTVLGHSQGEIAAAHIAGALTLTDAAAIVALRANALTTLAGTGAMASITLPATTTHDLLTAYPDLHIAAHNSPTHTIIAGNPESLTALLQHCETHNIQSRRIPVDYASHTPHIEPLRTTITTALAHITPTPATIPFYSTLTNTYQDTTTLTAEYWYQNLRNPVLFHPAVTTLHHNNHTTYIEISPHPVLTTAVTETLDTTPNPENPGNPRNPGNPGNPERNSTENRNPENTETSRPTITITGTLRRDHGTLHTFHTALAHLHTHGHTPTWHTPTSPTLNPTTAPTTLPTYPFQRRRYWLEDATPPGDAASLGLHATGHALLRAATTLGDGQSLLLTGRVSSRVHGEWAQHTAGGTAVLPPAAILELSFQAARLLGGLGVDELTINRPVLLPAEGDVDLQLAVAAPDTGAQRSFTVHARPHGPADAGDQADDDLGEQVNRPWTTHATGVLAPAASRRAQAPASWPPADAEEIPVDEIDARLATLGLAHGPGLDGTQRLWRRDGELFAEIALPERGADELGHFGLHPALLTAALSPLQAGLGRAAGHNPGTADDPATADDPSAAGNPT